MNRLGFRLWLEVDEADKPFVFTDLDETLVHSMEVGWLKDSKSNKNYAKLLVPGEPPYKDVKMIHNRGEELNIFPRPGVQTFLKEVSKFSNLYVLTHSGGKYAEKVVDALGVDHYIKGIFHTGEQKPGSLGEKFGLSKRSWVLVDNMGLESIEIINKLRILGVQFPSFAPKEEADKILIRGRDHFIKVADWVPTADEYDDYELWRIVPKIKFLLGIETSLP